METKFKVLDKVRILVKKYVNSFDIGNIWVIISIDNADLGNKNIYKIYNWNDYWYYWNWDFELVEDKDYTHTKKDCIEPVTTPTYVVYVENRNAPSKHFKDLQEAEDEVIRLSKKEKNTAYVCKIVKGYDNYIREITF